jgi:hypothetical protein
MPIMGMVAPFDQMAEIFPAAPAVSVQWITTKLTMSDRHLTRCLTNPTEKSTSVIVA